MGRHLEGLLAATDGSVGLNSDCLETMGAGACFRDKVLPDIAGQVPGEPCSLRDEDEKAAEDDYEEEVAEEKAAAEQEA